ncbi:cell cycle negative regulator roughex [Drosophila albomicans]|uniref:Cell cycle negative regulator roughex n=1 Tax=Drosophila albomicans TaxID=7291 RepID=A0A6P8X9S7_DROAB|nr:cell cycle negative regulator roughex [Drosophila albomicans]
MQCKNSVELSKTPAEILHQYVECINDGDVKRTVTEDCILNLFARSVQGGDAVARFLRIQLSGRYNHTDFGIPSCCAISQQELLTERYARRFERHWRRKRAAEEPRVDSDDDVEDANDDQSPNKRQVTPPRSSKVTTKLQYIEANGVLKTLRDNADDSDGGLDFGDCRQVRLVLGFRHTSAPQVCLIVYEKLQARSSRLPIELQRSRNHRNVHTDDEGETPAPLNVRRTLFGSGNDDGDEDPVILAVEVSPKPRPLSRKRPHARDEQQQKATKNPTTVFNSMRF